MSIQAYSYTLVTGNAPFSTGALINVHSTLYNTVYYRFSGAAAGSTATLCIGATDNIGNSGYIVDSFGFSGAGVQTNIATYITPVVNGIYGVISGLNGGVCGIYLDTAY